MSEHSSTDEASIEVFQRYLRINTVQPEPNYGEAVQFLKEQADAIGLQFKVVHTFPNLPVAILTWIGSEPGLKAVLLNSHMDVVPVFPEHWKYDPFSAHREDNGDIYARGSQDMKCVGIQYLEAVRRLKAEEKQFKRTIHLSFVPDEEIGSNRGMQTFVKMPEFQELNVGFSMDEGIASPSEVYQVFNGERNPWWVEVTCIGSPGHGSRFIENTAAEKARRIINSFMAFRDDQEQRLKSDDNLTLGDVTSVNLTILSGGVQPNVVPSEIKLTFDVRVPPTVDFTEFENQIQRWAKEAGSDVHIKYLVQNKFGGITPTTDDNLWWKAFADTMKSQKIPYKTANFFGATDARFIRDIGLPAIGFSPMIHTPVLLHDHNEFLNAGVFVEGIRIYYHLIPALANVPSEAG